MTVFCWNPCKSKNLFTNTSTFNLLNTCIILLENARSSGEWIGLVQYCKLIEDRRSMYRSSTAVIVYIGATWLKSRATADISQKWAVINQGRGPSEDIVVWKAYSVRFCLDGALSSHSELQRCTVRRLSLWDVIPLFFAGRQFKRRRMCLPIPPLPCPLIPSLPAYRRPFNYSLSRFELWRPPRPDRPWKSERRSTADGTRPPSRAAGRPPFHIVINVRIFATRYFRECAEVAKFAK